MLIRQTMLYLPAQLLGPLAQFVAAIVWTHLLSLGDYGHLMIVLSAQELVSLLCLSWWTHYTMRYIGTMKDGEARSRFQASENAVLLATGCAQIVVISILVFAFVDGASAGFLALSIAYTVSRCLVTHISERARADGNIADYSIAQIAGPLGGTLLGLVLMLTLDASPIEALAGYAIAQIASLAVIWHRLKLGFRIALPNLTLFEAAMRYGLPLLVAGAFGWASMNGIRLVVEYAQGAAAVGLISVGWGLGQRAIAVVAMLVTAASYPLALKHMNAGSRTRSLEQVSLNGALIIGVLAPATIGVLMVGEAALNLMVAEPFRAMSAIILPIAVAAASLRNSRVHFLDQVYLLIEKPSALLQVNVVEAVATMGFCALGLVLGGLPGAALGCVPGALIGWIYGYGLTRKYGLRLPWAHFLKIALATSFMALVLYLMPQGAGVVGLLIRISCGALSYCIAISLLYSGELRAIRSRAAAKPVN